ncbi:hypothetical protein ACHQM5_008098 [Ranunculus cassubicifolius]
MVLWEMTLATAYFLGLRRTYRLALKIERRLVSPNHPKIRHFLHRRTRAIFDMAVSVHRNVQQKDLEVGRNVGNRILRWLDRMKPSAEIRVKPPNNTTTMKQLPGTPGSNQKSNFSSTKTPKSDGRVLFSTPLSSFRSKSFPSWSMMMKPLTPVNTGTQFRQFNIGPYVAEGHGYGTRAYEGVFRKDVMQWISN